MNVKTNWYGDEVKKKMELRIKNSIARACMMVLRAAKYYCVVDTGRLRASITSNWTDSGIAVSSVEGKAQQEGIRGIGQPGKVNNEFKGVVGTNVKYAPFIELGTRKMSARPFLRVALQMKKQEIMRLFSKDSAGIMH